MRTTCIVVMPVYNEQACIESVCREWLAAVGGVDGRLLVVDDGSTDETPGILGRLAEEESRLLVVRQPNAGHGAAVVRGYGEAIARGAEWIFQVDSDGEMPAAGFAEMWRGRDRAPFLLGRRERRRSHWMRVALSEVHRRLVRAGFGAALPDPNAPYRLMRADVLARLMEHLPGSVFAPNVFLALLAVRAGLVADGASIESRPRAGGRASIRGWGTARVALRCLVELGRFRVQEFRKFRW